MRGWRAVLVIAALVPALRAQASSVTLSLPSGPAAASCTAAQLAQAIQSRRPDLHVLGGGPDGGAALEAAISVGPESGIWVLRVTSSVSAPLRRELPAPGPDCEELSQTVALMVARYLEDIHAATAPVAIDPIVHPPVVPPPPIQAVAEIGLGVGSGPTSVEPLVQLDLAGRRGAYQLGIAGSIGLRQPRVAYAAPSAGTFFEEDSILAYSILTSRVTAVGERRFALGPGTLRAGVSAGADINHVTVAGILLQHTTSTTSLSPLVGLRAGYEVGLPAGFAAGIRAEGWVSLSPDTFSVNGYLAAGDTLETNRFEGGMTAVVSRTFF